MLDDHPDRPGFLVIAIAAALTVLGIVGVQYYANKFAPRPVEVLEQPASRAGPEVNELA